MALSENEPDPFASIASEDGRIIFAEILEPGEGASAADDYERRITPDTLKEWYSSEKMHRHVVKILGWQGRKKGYKSLQIDPNDEDFRAATDVLHKRLAGSAFAFLLKYLGNEAIEDVIILFVGFGPLATGFVKEAVEKAEAAQQAQEQTEPPKPDNGAKPDGE